MSCTHNQPVTQKLAEAGGIKYAPVAAEKKACSRKAVHGRNQQEKSNFFSINAFIISCFFGLVLFLYLFSGSSKDCALHRSGFVLLKDGTCRKDFGAACGDKQLCIPGLVCDFENGICLCQDPDQVYVPCMKKCASRVGAPCDDRIPCVKNSFCQLFANSTNGLCVCPEGAVAYDEGGCGVAFGKKCSLSAECNLEAGVSCIDGSCKCAGFKQYRAKENKCVKGVGSACKTLRNGSDCPENAYCKESSPRFHRSGICTCNEGFIVSSDYTCILPK